MHGLLIPHTLLISPPQNPALHTLPHRVSCPQASGPLTLTPAHSPYIYWKCRPLCDYMSSLLSGPRLFLHLESHPTDIFPHADALFTPKFFLARHKDPHKLASHEGHDSLPPNPRISVHRCLQGAPIHHALPVLLLLAPPPPMCSSSAP